MVKQNEIKLHQELVLSLMSRHDMTPDQARYLIRLVFARQEMLKYLDDTDSLITDIAENGSASYNDFSQVLNEFSCYDADLLGEIFSHIEQSDIDHARA